MNSARVWLVLNFVFFSVGSVQTAEAKQTQLVPKIKHVGVNRAPVIFQSLALQERRSNEAGVRLFSGRVIAQWGIHVFESGTAFYACPVRSKTCRVVHYRRDDMFDRCVVRADRAVCSGRRVEGGGPHVDRDSRGPFDLEDPDFRRYRRANPDLEEFPARSDFGYDTPAWGMY